MVFLMVQVSSLRYFGSIEVQSVVVLVVVVGVAGVVGFAGVVVNHTFEVSGFC